MKSFITVPVCTALLLIASASKGETKDDDLVLCKEITKTKASLSDGIQQSSKTETPISAKFELDEKGKLAIRGERIQGLSTLEIRAGLTWSFGS